MRLPAALLAFIVAVPMLAQGPSASAPVARMAADAHPSFAVAAIHLHDPVSRRHGFGSLGERILVRDESVVDLIQIAYGLHRLQIAGAPPWASEDKYDIDGKCDTSGEPSLSQQREMLQKLLAERFGLHIKRESRELPVYALQIAKGGAKFQPAANLRAEPDREDEGRGTDTTQIYTASAMKDFVMGMNSAVDRPVVDQTGLKGRYDFRIHYTTDELRVAEPNAPPGLFTAIQEQLGLKLQPVKAPVEVFVIDHVERPSEN